MAKSKGIGLAGNPTPKPSPSMRDQEARYRAEDDLRTLQRAEEVRRDRARLNMAQRVAKEQVKSLATIAKKR